MMQQLPTLYDATIQLGATSEVVKAQLLLQRAQMTDELSKPMPAQGTVEWTSWDRALKLASNALLGEIRRLFRESGGDKRKQKSTLNAVYIELCRHKSLEKEQALNGATSATQVSVLPCPARYPCAQAGLNGI